MKRLIPLAMMFVVACGMRDEGTVTIRGDVPDLERMASRADSLVAEAGRPILIDSLRFALPVDSALQAADSAAGDPRARTGRNAGRFDSMSALRAPGDNPMSRRAQARGDSMARASARRFAASLDTGSRARGDSARGIVTRLGAEPARQTVLRDANGAIYALSGMATTGLGQLEGAEIVVRGVKVTSRDVVVSDYIVRAMNGIPAFDGRLEESDGAFTLVLTDGTGRKRLGAVPATLRGLAGSRVWVSMRQGDTPLAFGIIGRR